MPHEITHFIWGYQDAFRISLEVFAKKVLAEAGLDLDARAFLVGVQEPEGKSFPVCVEPERGPLPLKLFDDILGRIGALQSEDPKRNTIYGDEASNRDQPKWVSARAIHKAVRERLSSYDREQDVRSFVGGAVVVGTYSVVPVLQLPARGVRRLPALRRTSRASFRIQTSYLDAIVQAVLEHAVRELKLPEPGRFASESFSREAADVLREAARSFMYTPGLATGLMTAGGLFDGCNDISALRYEGTEGRGRMVVARKNHPAVHVHLGFARPVPIRKAGWARKVLQMGSSPVALLCDGSTIYGLGTLCDAYDPSEEDAFVVEFVGHFTWELRHDGTLLMRTS